MPVTAHDARVGRSLARRVLIRLAELVEPGTYSTMVTRRQLADYFGVRDDTIKRATRLLARAQVIDRIPVLTSNGFTAVVAYYLRAPGVPPPPAQIVRDEPLRAHQGPEYGIPGVPKLGRGRPLTDADRAYLQADDGTSMGTRLLRLTHRGVDRIALEAELDMPRSQLYQTLLRAHRREQRRAPDNG